MPEVNTLQVDGKPQVAVTCEPQDILQFLKKDLVPMNLMCDRAEMFEDRVFARTKLVFDFFGLPFDVTPPKVG